MDKTGFSYTAPPFTDLYGGMTNAALTASAVDGWLARPRTDLAALNGADQAPKVADSANPGYTLLSPERRRMYAKQLTQCHPDVATYREQVWPRKCARPLDRPRGRGTPRREGFLANQPRTYADCLSSRGFAAVQTPLQLAERYMRPGPPGSAARSFGSEADAACRAQALRLIAGRLAPQLAEWRRAHDDDLKRVQAGWRQIEAAAASYP